MQALLRAHLHQRQYVDQVQRVLKILAAEGGFQADHLELLWALTEKVGHSPFHHCMSIAGEPTAWCASGPDFCNESHITDRKPWQPSFPPLHTLQKTATLQCAACCVYRLSRCPMTWS